MCCLTGLLCALIKSFSVVGAFMIAVLAFLYSLKLVWRMVFPKQKRHSTGYQEQWFGKDPQPLSSDDIKMVEDDMSVRPFKISVPDAVLEDLKVRLERTRFEEPVADSKFQYGFNPNYLKKVVDYWRKDYDWRKHEAMLNQFPQFKTRIEGIDVHFLHVKPDLPPNSPHPTKYYQYSEEIKSFIRQNYQRKLPVKKMYRILEMYEKWNCYVVRYRSDSFRRFVLHYIAERAFWSGIQDNAYVAKVLEFLHETDNHFGLFLCPAACQGSCRLADFFLDHAYQAKLTVNGRRLADVEVFSRSVWLHPCELAVVSESPALLQLLLQYGALITDEPISLQGFRSYPAAGNMLVITLCVLRTLVEINRTEYEPQRFQDMIRCARLLMRVSPQYEKGVLHCMSMEFPGFNTAEEALKWIARDCVSELEFRVYSPMSLKHACRLKVRMMLHNTWQLPRGINTLPIPETLKEFINLHSD